MDDTIRENIVAVIKSELLRSRLQNIIRFLIKVILTVIRSFTSDSLLATKQQRKPHTIHKPEFVKGIIWSLTFRCYRSRRLAARIRQTSTRIAPLPSACHSVSAYVHSEAFNARKGSLSIRIRAEHDTTGSPREPTQHVDTAILSRSNSRRVFAVGSIADEVSLIRHRRTSSRFIKPRPLSDFALCRPARYYSPASWLRPPPSLARTESRTNIPPTVLHRCFGRDLLVALRTPLILPWILHDLGSHCLLEDEQSRKNGNASMRASKRQ